MRISDWSSDVCSSDLLDRRIADTALVLVGILEEQAVVTGQIEIVVARVQVAVAVDREDRRTACRQIDAAELAALRTAHLVAVVARQPRVIETVMLAVVAQRPDMRDLAIADRMQDRKSTRLNSSH